MDEMRAMTTEDLIRFLGSWRPAGEFRSPTPEGLARCFEELEKNEPARFAERSRSLQEVDPTYVRAFFAGLAAAIGAGTEFAINPALSLAKWVLDQPREIVGRE